MLYAEYDSDEAIITINIQEEDKKKQEEAKAKREELERKKKEDFEKKK